MKAAPALPLALLLAACGSGEPESAANAFARTSNELVAKAEALNAQVENELAQTERRLESDAAQAYMDVVHRFLGEDRPQRFLDPPKRGFFSRMFGTDAPVAAAG